MIFLWVLLGLLGVYFLIGIGVTVWMSILHGIERKDYELVPVMIAAWPICLIVHFLS